MNWTADRRRIYILVGIAYAISIGLAVVIFFGGGIFVRYSDVVNPLATGLIWLNMFVPTFANLATRRITHEGLSNTLMRLNLRCGWPFYLAALFLPALANVVCGAMYYVKGQFWPEDGQA